MNSKKKKSFADALLAADETIVQPSTSRPKPVKSVKKSKLNNVNEAKKIKGKKSKTSTDGERYTFHSLLGIEREIARLESVSSDEEITPTVKTFDRSKYGKSSTSNLDKNEKKSQPQDKLINKMLKADETQKKELLMLKEVNEDQLLFNLQLDSDEEMEDFNAPEVKVPVLPEGLPIIHSSSCHLLYTFDKIVWPFTAPMINEITWNVTGKQTVAYLVSLTKKEIRQNIIERTFMDPEIELKVLNFLLLYLMRYIAAYPHKKMSKNVSSDDDEVLVESSYQLICYHVGTTLFPANVLFQFLSEVPLALVNIGCTDSCFPPVFFTKWKMGELNHQTERNNTPFESIEQMKALYRLMTILCNCLHRTAEFFKKDEDVMSDIKTTDLDNLLRWLVLFSQDPIVINCSLQTIVGDAICHALELYTDFTSKIQDLVEIISTPWRDYGMEVPCESTDNSDDDTPSSQNQKLKSFPHHTASYVCCTILSATPKARMLASSLAFMSLCVALECDEVEVLDYVKMIDVINILKARRSFILQNCELYQLKSVLLLLDNCVTEILSRDQVEHNKAHYKAVDEFLRVECARVLGGGESSTNAINSTRLKTQITGIKSALLEKWEKLCFAGDSVYNPAGVRAPTQEH